MVKGVLSKPYYDRLVAYPALQGKINQLDVALDRVAKDPITRRAIATTRVPEIDLYSGQPNYLEEVHLRGNPTNEGIVLNMYTRWGEPEPEGHRDEMVELHERLARELKGRIEGNVIIGSRYEECQGQAVKKNERHASEGIPSVEILAANNSEAHWKLLKAVDERGNHLRTQYDRKDRETRDYIDPPSKDVRAVIHIDSAFAEPRYPIARYSETGKYIAEMLGVKDHLVVSYDKLINQLASDGKIDSEWPYHYHQRSAAYPRPNGRTINQLEAVVDKLADNLNATDAIISTRVPEIDLYITEDQPCLGQIQLLTEIDEQGRVRVNTISRWRSRDGYKAWPDNVVGVSSMVLNVAKKLGERIGKEVVMGWWREDNGSWHIYGQDYTQKGMNTFFDTFPDAQSYVNRSWTSEQARESVITELRMFRMEPTWKFPDSALQVIDNTIHRIESGELVC